MRFAATVLLWMVTTVALAVAVPAVWAQLNVVNVDGYAALARKAASDPALQAAAASELATEATALIAHHGYHVKPATVRTAAAAYTAGPSFPAQFAQANRLVHGWMFAGDEAADSWVVDVAPMLRDASLAQLLSDFGVRIPATLTVPLTVSTPEALRPGRLQLLGRWNVWLSLAATLVAAGCAVLVLVTARKRGRAMTALGIAALVVAAGGWAAVEVARRRVDDALIDTGGDIRRIAEAMVDYAEHSLHHWLNLTWAGGGLLVVLGVVVAALGGMSAERKFGEDLPGRLR